MAGEWDPTLSLVLKSGIGFRITGTDITFEDRLLKRCGTGLRNSADYTPTARKEGTSDPGTWNFNPCPRCPPSQSMKARQGKEMVKLSHTDGLQDLIAENLCSPQPYIYIFFYLIKFDTSHSNFIHTWS